jgi:hypothetical protein
MGYPSSVGSSEGIAELREKYLEMLAMRIRDAAADPDAADAARVRARMSALAARFPGALRELDDLEMSEIQRRIGGLSAVLAGAGEVEPWMEAIALFHRFARGALWAKRWLNGRRSVSGELEMAYAADAETLDLSGDALSWRTELAAVASPPTGRLTRLVYARMGQELGVTEAEARRRAFGSPRKERAQLGPPARATEDADSSS